MGGGGLGLGGGWVPTFTPPSDRLVGGGGGRALIEGEGGHRGSPRAVAERSRGM